LTIAVLFHFFTWAWLFGFALPFSFKYMHDGCMGVSHP
jgi:hypothetical protein